MKRYQVSKYFKFTLVLFLSSILLFLFYLADILRYAFPTELDAFHLDILRKKQYVIVTAKECITYVDHSPKGYSNSINGTVGFTKEYYNYTLKIGENAYVEVGLSDKKLIEEINGWPYGKGTTPITFIGRVERVGLGKKTEGKTVNVYLFQVNKEEVKRSNYILQFLSGLGICISLFMYFTFAGISKVFVKPLEDTQRYKDYYLGRSYHLERDLEREKKNLADLQLEQQHQRKYFWVGMGVVLGSLVGTLVFGYIWLWGVGDAFLTVVGMYIFIFLIYVHIWSITFTWNAFLNLDHPWAYKISDLFLLRTCSVKREEASKYISVITKRLERDKENNGQKQDEEKVLMWYGPGVWEQPEEKTTVEKATVEKATLEKAKEQEIIGNGGVQNEGNTTK